MDRPVSTAVAMPPDLDLVAPSGWDAHTVWQERVRNPQVAAKRVASTPRITFAAPSVGWDPTETWRLRLQRPRAKTA
jgi:hypothetical protein